MTIKIWNAFSPNNSSSYRLVARFEDPRVARETAVEIAEFLIGHLRENHGHWLSGPILEAFCAKYGLPGDDILNWSSHLDVDDAPEIATDHGVLVVYHYYCQGFEHLVPMLQAKGATVDPENYGGLPSISVLARSQPGAAPAFDDQLLRLFQHIDSIDPTKQPQWAPKVSVPWSTELERFDRGAYFRDAGTLGMWLPCEPQSLPKVEQWLRNHGIENPSLRWCEWADEALFTAIAKARCTACTGTVEYLDPRIHDIESPQFICRACGGLYEREALTRATD